jgi:acyl-coenzyme A synthetase/AMP-(fatty) acid ligase
MIQIAYPMPSYQVPNIETLLNETFAHYPYQKTFEDAKNDPLLVLHTSGTTSLPKPLTFTNDWTMAYMQALQLSSREGMELKEMYFSGNRFFVTMPPFHAAYLFTTFYIALLNETTIILPPSKTPPSVELFIEGIQRIEADAAFIQPSFVSQVAANPEYLDITTRRLDTLFTSGGKVFEPHGNIVSSRIRFLTVFGATEVGSLPDIIPSPSKPSHPDAWAYINPHPDAGWEFRLHTSNEVESIYEAWIVRSRNPEKEQPVFKLFPDCTEHSTRDLFVPHPKQPGLWKWHSRVDDTITLSTGANISPVIMENGLSEHPAIKGALMIGTGQLRPILLVELEDPPTVDANMGDILEQFWETVEQLNRHYYHDHRILKTHVLVARQERPMLRSQKGSIQRGFTADLYRPEIQDIYSRPAESHHVNGSSKMVGIAA